MAEGKEAGRHLWWVPGRGHVAAECPYCTPGVGKALKCGICGQTFSVEGYVQHVPCRVQRERWRGGQAHGGDEVG